MASSANLEETYNSSLPADIAVPIGPNKKRQPYTNLFSITFLITSVDVFNPFYNYDNPLYAAFNFSFTYF
jgi:hypothetical protein